MQYEMLVRNTLYQSYPDEHELVDLIFEKTVKRQMPIPQSISFQIDKLANAIALEFSRPGESYSANKRNTFVAIVSLGINEMIERLEITDVEPVKLHPVFLTPFRLRQSE